MFRVIGLQSAFAIVAVAICAALFGARGAMSAALGGAACVIPALWFAWRLQRIARVSSAAAEKPGGHVVAFFSGQLIKLVAMIGLMVSVGMLWSGVHWGAVVLAMAITLQANFFAFLIRT